MKYLTLIVINIFELACFFIVLPLIEHPMFGRKKTMVYTFILVVMVTMVLIVCGEENVAVLMGSFLVMRMAIGINAVVCFLLYTRR